MMLKSEARLAIAGWHKVVKIIADSEFTVTDQDTGLGHVEIQWFNKATKCFERLWITGAEFELLVRREAAAQAEGKHAELPKPAA